MRDFIHNLYLDLILKLWVLHICSPKLPCTLSFFSFAENWNETSSQLLNTRSVGANFLWWLRSSGLWMCPKASSDNTQLSQCRSAAVMQFLLYLFNTISLFDVQINIIDFLKICENDACAQPSSSRTWALQINSRLATDTAVKMSVKTWHLKPQSHLNLYVEFCSQTFLQPRSSRCYVKC